MGSDYILEELADLRRRMRPTRGWAVVHCSVCSDPDVAACLQCRQEPRVCRCHLLLAPAG
jgi:hypothetical protein